MKTTSVHLKQSPIHIIAILLIGVAGLDLATGNSNKPILPSFIGNYLTQQIDFVMIGIATFLLLFIS